MNHNALWDNMDNGPRDWLLEIGNFSQKFAFLVLQNNNVFTEEVKSTRYLVITSNGNLFPCLKNLSIIL